METIKTPLSLEEAANEYDKINFGWPSPRKRVIMEEEKTRDWNILAFKAGAEWQKEQDKELLIALESIAGWPGNLPDERYLSRTGANDAALRGSLVVAMRQIALSTLEKYKQKTV